MPYFFRERVVATLLAVVVFICAGFVLLTTVVSRSDLISTIYPSLLVDLTNDQRLESNAPPLEKNPLLTEAAQMKARHMAEHNYFAHFGPEGNTPWDWMIRADYPFVYAGENLAVDFERTESVAQAWMDSPPHRRNVLDDRFTEIGIATATGTYDGHEATYVVQMFGRPYDPDQAALPAGSVDTDGGELSSAQTDEAAVAGAQAKGSSVEDASITVLEHTDAFIAVRNADAPVVTSADSTPGRGMHSSFMSQIRRFLLDPTPAVRFTLQLLMTLVAAALLVMIAVNVRVQRSRNILYGVLLLVIMMSVYYITGLLHTPYDVLAYVSATIGGV